MKRSKLSQFKLHFEEMPSSVKKRKWLRKGN